MTTRRAARVLFAVWVAGFVLPGVGGESNVVAAQRTWIGGNADWLDNGSTANWNPADEPDADDEAVFNTPNTVNLGSNNLILALTMSGGIDLFTNDFDLNVDGLVQLTGAGTNLFVGGTTGLVDADDVGNDVNMNGTVNVSASPIIGARIDFGSTAVVNITTSSRLTLAGGGSNTADSNTINGATINGPGILHVGPGKGLVGFGTINAPIDFDGGVTDLEADNGMLTVNGAILDVGSIGPVDADGILNVPAAWNSIVAEAVRLRGGEFRGGTITIDNPLGVRGFGLMSSPLVNNSQIVAESGTLIGRYCSAGR